VIGTDLPYSFGALQRHPRSSPNACCELSTLSTGPLSGFLNLSAVSAWTEFHGLISYRNRSWTASLQSLPLTKIVYPSRGHWLPCSCPPCCGNVSLVTLSLEVSPTPTLLTQLPGSPTSYGSPFHESEDPLPGRPGSQAARSFLPPASPASKLFSLRESVRTASGYPEPSGRSSLGFLPLLRFATAQTSDPLTHLCPHGLKSAPSPEGSDPRLQGPLTPGAG